MEPKSLNDWAQEIATWREEKGFHTPSNIASVTGAEAMLGKLMLVVSEVSEAAEAVRDRDFNHFIEELADTFIRLLDIVGTVGIDINTAIADKMAVNHQRATRHGRKIRL